MISSEQSTQSWVGNDSASTFSIPFRVQNRSDIVAEITLDATGVSRTLVENTDYTISNTTAYTGWQLNLIEPVVNYGTAKVLAVGETLTVSRAIAFTQTTDFRGQGTFSAEVHEDRFDRTIMLTQSLRDSINKLAQRFTSSVTQVWQVARLMGGTSGHTDLTTDPIAGSGTVNFPAATVCEQVAYRSWASSIASLASSIGATLLGYLAPFTGAVLRTQHDKNKEFINVSDWGAGAVGNTDAQNTAAIQAAVDYCITNHKDLCVDKVYTLTTSINVDQPRDDATYDDYFTIFTNTRGGFRVTTAIPMFASSLAYVADGPNWLCPVGLVRWQDITFSCSNSALSAYVIAPFFLRSKFLGCSFSGIKLLAVIKATKAVIIQSLHLIGCNARRYSGTFLSSDNINFDVHLDDCLLEAGGDGVFLAFPTGCSITNSTIQGQDYFAVKYTGPRAFDIVNCYFEANGMSHTSGCSIDGSGAVGGGGGEGIKIAGCYLSGDNVTPSKPQILWGDNTVGVSLGNFCNTTMHGLTATSRINSIGDYAETALSNYNSKFSGTMLRDWVGIGNMTNPLAEVHIDNGSAKPKVLLTGTGLAGGYGGYLTGYGVAGQGGRVALGTFQAGSDGGESIVVDENKATHIFLTTFDPGRFANSEMTFQLVSNTSLKIFVRGSDGVSRSATLTLA